MLSAEMIQPVDDPRRITYWKKHFEGGISLLALPNESFESQGREGRFAIHTLVLPDGSDCHSTGTVDAASSRMDFLACLYVLLRRYSGQNDICFGWAEGSGSHWTAVQPIRLDLKMGASYHNLVGELRQRTAEALENRVVPLTRLMRELDPVRDWGKEPLFKAMVITGSAPISDAIEEFRADWESVPPGCDLAFIFEESKSSIKGGILFRADVFESGTIERMGRHFANLLTQAAQSAPVDIDKMDLMDQAEENCILYDWNKSEAALPENRTVLDFIEEQALLRPEKTALRFEDRVLTYRQLEAHANRFSNRLTAMGDCQGKIAALCMERSLELVVAMVGAMKAGMAILPIDTSFPEKRVDQILGETRPFCVIANHGYSARKCFASQRTIEAEPEFREFMDFPDSPPPYRPGPHDLAYVITTSGSTGNPKAAMNSHLGFLNHKVWMHRQMDVSHSDVFLQKAPYSFDVSIWEFFLPLMYGAELILAAPGMHKDPAYLVGVIRRQRITIVHFVPSMLKAMVETPDFVAQASIRLVIVSGEALPVGLQRRFHQQWGIPLVNVYGPAECADVSTFFICPPGYSGKRIPIGKPISNTRCYVLDAGMRPTPVGVIGEIHIGGMGVGFGYLGNPTLTGKSFVPSPFVSGDTLYKTGDLGYFDSAGCVHYSGRNDFQVKIRGMRVELSEIEEAISLHPLIADVVVNPFESGAGNKALACYYTVNTPELPAGELREFLSRSLPSYMVPAAFMKLDRIPINGNGKVDRGALPQPDLSLSGKSFVDPGTETEKSLASLWSELLGIEKAGLNDNFFELGGDSLLAVQAQALIKESLGKDADLRSLFENPTLAGLARLLDSLPDGRGGARFVIPKIPEGIPAPTSYQQDYRRKILGDPASATDLNIVCCLKIGFDADSDLLVETFRRICERHSTLRTRFSGSLENGVQLLAEAAETCDRALRFIREGGLTESDILDMIRMEADHLFDPSAGPLFRVTIVEDQSKPEYILININHIIADGWSLKILLEEIRTIYRALAAGESIPLQPLPLEYRDYARWERNPSNLPQFEEALAHFGSRLRTLPVFPPFLGGSQASGDASGMRTVSFDVSKSLERKIRSFCSIHGSTEFCLYLACLKKAFMEECVLDELIAAIPVANRAHPETQGMIAPLQNLVLLKSSREHLLEFGSFLEVLNAEVVGASTYQHVPAHLVFNHIGYRKGNRWHLLFSHNANIDLVLPGRQAGSFSLVPSPPEALRTGDSIYVASQEFNDHISLMMVYDSRKYSTSMLLGAWARFESSIMGFEKG